MRLISRSISIKTPFMIEFHRLSPSGISGLVLGMLEIAENTSVTDEPPSPSSSDGHPSLIRLSVPHNRTRLAAKDARRSRSPYRVRLTARTGRR